jgi:NAD kinase
MQIPNDNELLDALKRRGSDADVMLATWNAHCRNLDRLLESLETAGSSADVVRSSEYKRALPSTFGEYDAILSAGGDGTFIDAASHVVGPTPVIGFNTDPARFVC